MQVLAEGSVEVVALEPRFAQTGDGAGVEVGAETAAKAPGALGTRVVSGSTDTSPKRRDGRASRRGEPARERARHRSG